MLKVHFIRYRTSVLNSLFLFLFLCNWTKTKFYFTFIIDLLFIEFFFCYFLEKWMNNFISDNRLSSLVHRNVETVVPYNSSNTTKNCVTNEINTAKYHKLISCSLNENTKFENYVDLAIILCNLMNTNYTREKNTK